MTGVAVVAGWLGSPARAAADRYEVSVTVRPLGAIGRITERAGDVRGGEAAVSRNGGGGEVGLSYGVRNWLDVGAEVIGAGFARAIYRSGSHARRERCSAGAAAGERRRCERLGVERVQRPERGPRVRARTLAARAGASSRESRAETGRNPRDPPVALAAMCGRSPYA